MTPEPRRTLAGDGFTDIVDFVERTTYKIWNDRNPDLVLKYYPPHSVIWSDDGDLVGGEAVTADTHQSLNNMPDFHGIIHDTIWTGDDESGYRTSMRWIARGTDARSSGSDGSAAPAGRRVLSSCIANCVVLDTEYIEEWSGADDRYFFEQLGSDVAAVAAKLPRSGTPRGEAGRQRTRGLGVTVPAIPDRVDGAGLYVRELLDDLYNKRDLSVADTRYAPGASYVYGCSRWNAGPAGVRAEVTRWLDLLPDLRLEVEELYWRDDTPARSRVAVRYLITGTAQRDGRDREVAITGIHHVHVRGDLVVAEWAEYNELALLAQLG